jgi:hypothetical protein
MNSADSFRRALERALASRAKQLQSNVGAAPVTSTSSASFVKEFNENKYKATIITKMKALIAKHKGITANHSQ